VNRDADLRAIPGGRNSSGPSSTRGCVPARCSHVPRSCRPGWPGPFAAAAGPYSSVGVTWDARAVATCQPRRRRGCLGV